MIVIQTKEDYNIICERIEELLMIVGNDTPIDDINFIELNSLSDLIADYEERYGLII